MPDDGDTWWDEAYDGDPPWDIGRPQPAFVELADAGALAGRVLDAGCGTGTHACHLAERGHTVTGVDSSTRAVELAREKAEARGLDVDFRVADALDLPAGLGPFDTVVDCGLLHVFDTDDLRRAYADELAAATAPGGRAFVLAFGTDAPADWGPTPVSPADLRRAFGRAWTTCAVEPAPFVTNDADVPGLLATFERRRTGGD